MTLLRPEALAWFLSIVSSLMLWLMGNKSKWGPRLGIANQLLWIAYAAWLHQWGLLPGIVIYTVIHVRNAIKWNTQKGTLQ